MTISAREEMVNGWDVPVGTYELIEKIVDAADLIEEQTGTTDFLNQIQTAQREGAHYDALGQARIEQALAENSEIAAELAELDITSGDILEVMDVPANAVLEVADYTPM